MDRDEEFEKELMDAMLKPISSDGSGSMGCFIWEPVVEQTGPKWKFTLDA